MIDIRTLTVADFGRGVVYKPAHGPREDGVITAWNDHFIFVRYRGHEGSNATRAEDLEWLIEDEPPTHVERRRSR